MVTFITLSFLTMFLGFSGAFFFGTNGSNLITLNLTTWDGKIWTADSQPFWAATISLILRLLPPIWVFSCLPICGATLSINALEMVPQHLRDNKKIVFFVRILAVAPAVILAGFARCLGDIIEFTGLCAYILLIMPALVLVKA